MDESEYFKLVFNSDLCISSITIQNHTLDITVFENVMKLFYGFAIQIPVEVMDKYLFCSRFLRIEKLTAFLQQNSEDTLQLLPENISTLHSKSPSFVQNSKITEIQDTNYLSQRLQLSHELSQSSIMPDLLNPSNQYQNMGIYQQPQS